MRAQEKYLAKFPIKPKVEDLVVYVFMSSAKLWSRYRSHCLNNTSNPNNSKRQLQPPYSGVHLNRPLWAQRRLQGGHTGNSGSDPALPRFFPATGSQSHSLP